MRAADAADRDKYLLDAYQPFCYQSDPVPGWDAGKPLQARSSVGEHYLDTVGVSGSIPLVPT